MKRVNCDISDLEKTFSSVDISENPEYVLLQRSVMAKYTYKGEMVELLQSARERYLRYIKYINFENYWRIEQAIFEFLSFDISKNTRKMFELMKCIDNMILNIIDTN